MEPPVAVPATVGRQEAKPRSPPSGEAVRAGAAGPRLAAYSSLPDAPGGRPHATGRQDSGRV